MLTQHPLYDILSINLRDTNANTFIPYLSALAKVTNVQISNGEDQHFMCEIMKHLSPNLVNSMVFKHCKITECAKLIQQHIVQSKVLSSFELISCDYSDTDYYIILSGIEQSTSIKHFGMRDPSKEYKLENMGNSLLKNQSINSLHLKLKRTYGHEAGKPLVVFIGSRPLESLILEFVVIEEELRTALLQTLEFHKTIKRLKLIVRSVTVSEAAIINRISHKLNYFSIQIDELSTISLSTILIQSQNTNIRSLELALTAPEIYSEAVNYILPMNDLESIKFRVNLLLPTVCISPAPFLESMPVQKPSLQEISLFAVRLDVETTISLRRFAVSKNCFNLFVIEKGSFPVINPNDIDEDLDKFFENIKCKQLELSFVTHNSYKSSVITTLNNNIEVLKISYFYFADMNKLLGAISHSVNLKEIVLNYTNVNNDFAFKLYDSIALLRKLKSIDLMGNHIKLEGGLSIAKAAIAHNHGKKIDLTQSQFIISLEKLIDQAIEQNMSTKLNYREKFINDDGPKWESIFIIKAITNPKALDKIRGIMKKAMRCGVIFGTLYQKLSKLCAFAKIPSEIPIICMSLQTCKFTKAQFMLILRHLKSLHKQINCITLIGMKNTEKSLRYLGNLVKDCSTTILDISYSRIKTYQLNTLCHGLCNTAIKSLNLQSSSIGDGGCQKVLDSLPLINTVRYLNLNNCGITDTGIAYYLNTLGKLSHIKCVELVGNSNTLLSITQCIQYYTAHPEASTVTHIYIKLPITMEESTLLVQLKNSITSGKLENLIFNKDPLHDKAKYINS
jgi:hypothetical protein